MKKHHVLGLALLAVFAFSAILAVSASAAETLLAEWLINGASVTTLTSVTTEGKLLLEDEKVPIAGKVSVVCEGILDGSVGANGEDEITEVLNLEGKKVESEATALSCPLQEACEEAGKVWPAGLPWHTLLILVEEEIEAKLVVSFKDLIQQSTAGYNVLCKVFGIAQEDKCVALGNSGGKVSNGATDVLLTAETIAPNGNCSLGGNGSGKIQVVEGLIFPLMTSETLTVSE
jgi:hypothetical protein